MWLMHDFDPDRSQSRGWLCMPWSQYVLAVNKSAFSPQRLSLAVLTRGRRNSTATSRGWGEKAWERGYSAVAVRNNA